ncbi:HAMP domain-containing histidine kinase [Paenibacillus rhizovicinus]|uniref:histidine kinase n=1 Tax=Paenibacillus rhizovicinus TaxID=2704463 RepID=A0A6C0P7Y9_9BACL|nr:HAMP domain-containing sensor histidine kinase [Paenibacillus rhizovicinus]QHW34750.1 HAMP domain-containing histidine kinase [Paenibacillus rhizovicinus]
MSEIERFFETHQDTIVANWIHRMDMAYHRQYNLDALRLRGLFFIDIIADIHIPIEQHRRYKGYEQWCEELFQNNIPINHILQGSLFFREAFLETISEFDVERSELVRIIASVASRLDAFVLTIYQYFWDHVRGKIEQQNKMIEDMHADKLNLIGKMASSMAHEIRNPLTTINGFVALIRKALPATGQDAVKKYLDIIDHEFQNIEQQIKGFLSFSRKPIADEEYTSAQLNLLIEKTLLLVNPLLLNENIELNLNRQDGLQILIQEASVIQVFSNLLNNAIDALREKKDDRRIVVQTYSEDTHAYVKITNNGPEIPREIQQKLFDPFVTGKTDGTGLGLAICKQIVERNNGAITFETSRDATSFIVRFSRLMES